MPHERVVITGVGPLTPHAASREALWRLFQDDGEQAIAGSATARHVTDPPEVDGAARLRQMDPLGRLVLTVVALALEDARLDPAAAGDESVGIAFGSGYGCLAANAEYLGGIIRRGARYGNPVVFQNTVPNAAVGYASVARGLRGPTATFSSGFRSRTPAYTRFDSVRYWSKKRIRAWWVPITMRSAMRWAAPGRSRCPAGWNASGSPVSARAR